MKGWLKDFRLLLGVLMKRPPNIRPDGKRQFPQGLIVALSFLPIMVMVCVLLARLAPLAASHEVTAEFAVVLIAAAQSMVLFFALGTIAGTLYVTQDAEFVSALPLRPSAVFFARLTKLYLGEVTVSLYLLLPLLYTFGGAVDAAGYPVSPAFYVLVPLIACLAPVLPLAIAVILSLPVVWLASFFKRRAAVGTVALAVVYFGIFAAYFMTIPNLGGAYDIDSLSAELVMTLRSAANILYPDKVLALTALGIDAGKNFGISVGIWGGMIVLVFLLASLFYRRAVRTNSESGAGKGTVPAGIFKARGQISALISADAKSIMRYPSLALPSLTSAMFTPLLTAFFFLTETAGSTAGEGASHDFLVMGVIVMVGVAMNGGSNYLALIPFTREGGQHALIRSLPVSGKKAVLAKFIMATAINVVSVLVTLAVVLGFGKLHYANALMCMLIILALSAGLNSMSIRQDMKHPNFDWKDISDVQRQNSRMIIPMFAGLAIAAAVVFVPMVLSTSFASSLGTAGMYALYWGLVVTLTAGVTAGFTRALFARSEELYEGMRERSGEGVPSPGPMRSKGLFGGGKKGGMLG